MSAKPLRNPKETIPGGIYFDTERGYVNANGEPINADGSKRVEFDCVSKKKQIREWSRAKSRLLQYELEGRKTKVFIKEGYIEPNSEISPEELAERIKRQTYNEAFDAFFGTYQKVVTFARQGLISREITCEITDEIFRDINKLHEQLLDKELSRAFGLRNKGRKPRSINIEPPKFESKTDFLSQIKDYIYDFSAEEGNFPTQKQAAETFEFSSAKALQRKLRRSGIKIDWRIFCRQVLEKKESES